MLALKIPILLLTIVLALVGLYIIVMIYIKGKGIDNETLRARAFLNDSFLKENWILLLLLLFLFILRSVVEIEETLQVFMDEPSSELLDEIIVLGILICIILIIYKWYRLINLPKKLF